jgi:hypothetical protein
MQCHHALPPQLSNLTIVPISRPHHPDLVCRCSRLTITCHPDLTCFHPRLRSLAVMRLNRSIMPAFLASFIAPSWPVYHRAPQSHRHHTAPHLMYFIVITAAYAPPEPCLHCPCHPSVTVVCTTSPSPTVLSFPTRMHKTWPRSPSFVPPTSLLSSLHHNPCLPSVTITFAPPRPHFTHCLPPRPCAPSRLCRHQDCPHAFLT